jgi:hypothetical protein
MLRIVFPLVAFISVSTVLAQENNDILTKEQKEEPAIDNELLKRNDKQQQTTDLKQTTTSYFKHRRTSFTNTPKLSTIKTQTHNTYLGEFKTKKENTVSDFSVKSAGGRVKDSFTNKSWEFTADGNGNNSGDLQNQALGVFKNDQSVSSFNTLRSEPGKFATTDVKAKATDLLKKEANSEEGGLKEIENASKKIISVEKPSMYGQEAEAIPELSPQVYSEKIKQQLKDSLGWDQIEKFSNALSTVAKKNVSQQDFINALNKAAPENKALDKIDLNSGTIKGDDGSQLKSLNDKIEARDLSVIRLPDSVMSQLEPLRNFKVPDKYAQMADSLRDVYMENTSMSLEEKKVSDELKTVVAKKKPGLLDKFYAEAIMGYLKDGKATLFQGSPSLAYHFMNFVSLGAGPNILGRIEGKKVDITMGFRTYVKAEIFKQRAYLQVEDNVTPVPIKSETLWQSPHNVLTGGGILFPISKKLSINMCLLYRVNNHGTDHSSPWVFRFGLSSTKLK